MPLDGTRPVCMCVNPDQLVASESVMQVSDFIENRSFDEIAVGESA